MTPKRKVMVVVMVITFAAAIWAAAWSLPAGEDGGAAARPGEDENKITAKEESTGAFEKGSEENPTLKKKKFPWLLVSAGAVAAGVIVYFTLVKKPEYKLTVAMTNGVRGNLLNGVHKYRKGDKVHYSYSLIPYDPRNPTVYYLHLTVLLDGRVVSPLGEIKMDRDHYIQAMAGWVLTVQAGIGVKGIPGSGKYPYLPGEQAYYSYDVEDGYGSLRVILDGKIVPPSGSLIMDHDHTLRATSEPLWASSWDEQGTWLMVEQLTSGGRLEYTLSFKRDPFEVYFTGNVEMQGGQPDLQYPDTFPYWRGVTVDTRKVMLEWFTVASEYRAWRYMGTFVDERTVGGSCLYYYWPSGGCLYHTPEIKSTWTMTKVSGTTSRR